MKALLPGIAKGVLSAAYWFTCWYLAGGLLFGDRIANGRIVTPALPVPPLLFVVIAVALYATLSLLWDRWAARSGR